MHQLEGARHGLHYVYRTIEIAEDEATTEQLRLLLDAAQRLGFNGLNITHPIKQTVIPLLDELAPAARQVGAVNTVLFDSGRMIGHNTDVTGFGSAFDEAFGQQRQGRVVLVGAGGAGAAVASALLSRGVEELVITDADGARAETLAASLNQLGAGDIRSAGLADLPAVLSGAEGIINATPHGMAASPGTAFDPDLLEERLWVADVVYRPAETELLAQAKARGCRVMNGLGMAMGQAADAFQIFTGEPADRQAMLADLMGLVAAEGTAAYKSVP